MRVKKKKIFFAILVLLSIILRILFVNFSGFAEFYTLHIAPIVRVPLSFISSLFPFSVAESVILIFSFFTVMTIFSGIRLLVVKILKKDAVSNFKKYLKTVVYMLLFVFFTYSFSFSSSYARKPIKDTLGINSVEMSAENVVLALDNVTDELNSLADSIEFTQGQSTNHGYSFNQLSKKVRNAARKASIKYPIFQKGVFTAKAIAFSEPMAYTGISGVYGFFTGEANINTSFSDYSMPFTIAHEYSHQMGIGSEKEAEFAALLICMESDDPYIKYSAYSQVAVTLSNILFELDEPSFYKAFSAFPDFLITDVYLSAENHSKYSQTVADEIATAVNDTYLSLSGDEGVISYSLSSELYVSYFLRGNK